MDRMPLPWLKTAKVPKRAQKANRGASLCQGVCNGRKRFEDPFNFTQFQPRLLHLKSIEQHS